jgi:hypothetical protein
VYNRVRSEREDDIDRKKVTLLGAGAGGILEWLEVGSIIIRYCTCIHVRMVKQHQARLEG